MFKKTKIHKDGSTEILTLHHYEDGTFRLLVSVASIADAKRLAEEWNVVGGRVSGPNSKVALVNFEDSE